MKILKKVFIVLVVILTLIILLFKCNPNLVCYLDAPPSKELKEWVKNFNKKNQCLHLEIGKCATDINLYGKIEKLDKKISDSIIVEVTKITFPIRKSLNVYFGFNRDSLICVKYFPYHIKRYQILRKRIIKLTPPDNYCEHPKCMD